MPPAPRPNAFSTQEGNVYNIFWLIGVIVVILAILSFLGLR
jgi:uncharacterized membrane protein YkgB